LSTYDIKIIFIINYHTSVARHKSALIESFEAYRVDDEIIDDTDFIKKYNEAENSKNATIQALVVANIIDQILREY
jgi:hypothetical protein